VRELQDAGVVSATPVGFFPDSSFLAGWLGIFPFAEPLALQAVLLAAAVFALFRMLWSGTKLNEVEVRPSHRAAG
jgi:high-affinity Fe2+/Pb2+ permease